MKSMYLPLLALALAAFGIGTTEFVIMGLLPDVARDLDVTIPDAGMLITGYALGVAIGAPIMAFATARFPRKKALIGLMAIFIAGNAFCAMAENYDLLMIARVVTALCHGAFFGIGSIAAANLAPPNRRASAIAMMFMGLTIANVLGVPFGTLLGQEMGWRATFWAVTAIGVAAFAALAFLLPRDKPETPPSLLTEMAVLRDVRVWMALGLTIFNSAAIFALFTYIAPILGEITQITPRAVSYTLLLIGVGLTVGNFIGGRMTDRHPRTTLLVTFIAVGLFQLIFYWSALSFIPAEITLFLWGVAFFASCSAVHYNAITAGSRAPNLISTINVGAFNTGNALGAWAGGKVIEAELGLRAVPLTAVGFSVLTILLCLAFLRTRGKDTGAQTPQEENDKNTDLQAAPHAI